MKVEFYSGIIGASIIQGDAEYATLIYNSEKIPSCIIKYAHPNGHGEFASIKKEEKGYSLKSVNGPDEQNAQYLSMMKHKFNSV